MKTCDMETCAIGYMEIKDCILGNLSLDKAIDLMSIKTSQYAKRQSTWFKNQMEYDQIYKVNDE